jgi:hypothetical protein
MPLTTSIAEFARKCADAARPPATPFFLARAKVTGSQGAAPNQFPSRPCSRLEKQMGGEPPACERIANIPKLGPA